MSESTPPPPPPPPPPGPPSDGSGWGATPPPGSPPPPPGGYGQPAYGGPPAPSYSVGDALSFGWAKFQANVGPILLSGLVLLVGLGIFLGISIGISAALTSDPSCTFRDDGSYSCSDGTGFVVGLVVQAITTADKTSHGVQPSQVETGDLAARSSGEMCKANSGSWGSFQTFRNRKVTIRLARADTTSVS